MQCGKTLNYIIYKEEASYSEAETNNLARLKPSFWQGAELQFEDFKGGDASDLFCWLIGMLTFV